MKDVRPVSQMARSVMVFIASPQFPARDAKEAIAYIKAHPGQLSFASYSQGTASQYAGAILNQKAGLDMQHVPFPGSAPALAQIMGNQIPLMFDGSVTTKPLVPSGKVKLLAVAYKSRLSDFPNVPTMAEVGYPGWISATGPASLLRQRRRSRCWRRSMPRCRRSTPARRCRRAIGPPASSPSGRSALWSSCLSICRPNTSATVRSSGISASS